MTSDRLRETVEAGARRVRLDAWAAVVAVVLSVLLGVLGAAWLLGAAWSDGGAGPLVLLLCGGAMAMGAAVLLLRRWVRPLTEDAVASALERQRGLDEGALRGVLELGRELPPGASRALLHRAQVVVARAVEGLGPSELMGELGVATRRRLRRVAALGGALLLLVAAAGFGAPDRARVGWQPLLHPLAHLEGRHLMPIRVAPGDTAVDRGESVDVRVTAPGRSSVQLNWRAVGDVPHQTPLAVVEGRGAATLGPVASPIRYWVQSGAGVPTDTFTLRPLDPLLLSSLAVEVRYPSYMDRPPDSYDRVVPALRVPEGSLLSVRGAFTRPVAGVGLEGPSGRTQGATIRGSEFSLEWQLRPNDTGAWDWAVDPALGTAGVSPLELEVVREAAPVVRLLSPAPDAALPPSRLQHVRADASDDHGLSSASLVLRRIGAGGERSQAKSVSLAVDAGVDRAVLDARIDVREEPLGPGDVVEYYVEVRDNSPDGQVGRSPTRRLVVPDRAAMRAAARDAAVEAQAAAERLAERSRGLQEATRNLSRRAAASGRSEGTPGQESESSGPAPLEFRDAREAEEILQGHEELLAQGSELEQRIDALRRAVEEAGLQDPETRARLDEMRRLYSQLATPELREQLEALREGTEALDARRVQRALEQLASRQEELRRTVDQVLQMMRRSAAEQRLDGLAREADELAARQSALSQAMAADDDSAAAAAEAEQDDATVAQQEEVRRRTDRLTAALDSMRQELVRMDEGQGAEQASAARRQGTEASRQMARSAQQARAGRGGEAAAAGRRAADRLTQASATLDSARAQLSSSWAGEARRAVQQATQDALTLAQRQESLRRELERGQSQGRLPEAQLAELRSEQAALHQGLQQLERNLTEAGRGSGVLQPVIGRSLNQAVGDIERALESMQEGRGRTPVLRAARAVDSLNRLAMRLLESEQGGSAEASGNAVQQALQQLSQLAREQASLNGQVGAVSPMDLGEQELARQLAGAADRQRRIAQQVQEVDRTLPRQEALGRLDQLAEEAEALAAALGRGQVDPEVRARQERLFRRLLDAGRSLERDEYGQERSGSHPGAVEAGASPVAIDPGLLDRSIRYPPPTAEQLRALPPAYRRLILEYFDRLNSASPGGTAGVRQ